MERIIACEFPPFFPYMLNGKQRTMPYYLADGIYPNWAIFIKTIKDGTAKKDGVFANAQEAIRKDIERAFGVLVARFHILQHPSRLWQRSDVSNVMIACIILHNMIVENRRDNYESGMASLQHFSEARAMFATGQSFTWESESATRYYFGNELPLGMWASMVSSRHSSIMSTVDHFSLNFNISSLPLHGSVQGQ